ncbi:MAG: DUF3127 domain-containing protein [Bacteroides sp.]|nr:DUF3127 domain-containing protein [Roseburia sp.]MCM1347473.1 DUF3127 domain-containing protein [Bacteroides sp.]MCM1421326.1 DUF3127 domain-containing protein [Bacteroides sp.]
MELAGRIITVLEARSGVAKSTGNPWKVQEYVVETHEQYPRRMCFSVFGEDKISQMNIQQGDEVNVFFDIDAHEYQGRWFNSIRAWKVDHIQPGAPVAPEQPPFPGAYQQAPAFQQSAQPAAPAATVDFSSNDSADDLPF